MHWQKTLSGIEALKPTTVGRWLGQPAAWAKPSVELDRGLGEARARPYHVPALTSAFGTACCCKPHFARIFW